MSCNKTNLVNAAIVEVCKVCENYFGTSNFEPIYCDGCKRWIHLNCCGISEHEFNFYANNEELNTVANNDYCKTCFKKFTYLDDCLFCERLF